MDDIVDKLNFGCPFKPGTIGEKDAEKAEQVMLDAAEYIEKLRRIISEVHSWVVCAAITTPEDMAQNFERIEEITNPTYKP